VPVHVTDFSVANVHAHVDELSSAQIWQHELCATYSATLNINDRLPIKVYCRICTHRHIRIEVDHGSQNVFWVLTWVGGYWKVYPSPLVKELSSRLVSNENMFSAQYLIQTKHNDMTLDVVNTNNYLTPLKTTLPLMASRNFEMK
jgi:hypothetical protein